MEEYKQGHRLENRIDGDARSSDSFIVVSLPVETVEFRGEDIVYRREAWFLEEELSDLERRERSTEELVDEYWQLIEEHGEKGLSLIDAEPESVKYDVIGILEWRKHGAVCYFEVPEDVEQEILKSMEQCP